MNTFLTSIDFIPLMKTAQQTAGGTTSSTEYVIGAIIALFILGYLVYTLIRPDKF